MTDLLDRPTIAEPISQPALPTAVDLIRHGIRILEEHGWVQGRLYDQGAHCVAGALGAAAGLETPLPDDVDHYPTEDAYKEAMRLLDFATIHHTQTDARPFHDVVAYNDAHGRTRDEVLAIMRKAAEMDA